MAQIEKTVFISYRRKDISWALLVYDYLTSPKRKYDVFFDFTSIPAGDFEQIILSNIKARAHFVLLLTPTALDRCNEPGDWLRREVEFAIEHKRNIIPLFLDKFSFSLPGVADKLTGKLSTLKRYNGLEVPPTYFKAAMDRLRKQFLNIPLDTVLLPISIEVQQFVKQEQAAADQALIQKSSTRESSIKQGVSEGSLKPGPQSMPVEEAASTLDQQKLETRLNPIPEPAVPRPLNRLVFYPTVELTLRDQPVISPDTVIRRVAVTEQLLSLEPEPTAARKVGVNNQWLKVRDLSGTEGYVAAWCVTLRTSEFGNASVEEIERQVDRIFKSQIGSLAEEASSELVQRELEAMSQAAPEDIERLREPVPPLQIRLQRIVQEFATGEIGKDTSMEELNLILNHLPKTSDLKG